MLKIIALIFALAAVVGITLAAMHLRKKYPSLKLAFLHLLLGATGLVTFIVAFVQHAAVRPLSLSLALFVVAALGGLIMFALHLKNKPLPVPLILFHGLAAVIAFILLLTRLPYGG